MSSNDHTVTRRRRLARSPRKGLTLFELLLALAIFLTSLAALAQLLASGSRAAAQSQFQTEAILRCESKLGELVSGITPIKAVSNQAFDDDPNWSWRLTVTSGPWPNLQLVELQVAHTGQSSLGNSSYTLQRYVRDPRLFVDAAPRSPTTFPNRSGNGTRNQPATQPNPGPPRTSAASIFDRGSLAEVAELVRVRKPEVSRLLLRCYHLAIKDGRSTGAAGTSASEDSDG